MIASFFVRVLSKLPKWPVGLNDSIFPSPHYTVKMELIIVPTYLSDASLLPVVSIPTQHTLIEFINLSISLQTCRFFSNNLTPNGAVYHEGNMYDLRNSS